MPGAARPAAKPKVSAREAAEVVLIEQGRPMHYREIAALAVEQGIVRVPGSARKKADLDRTTKTIRSYLCEMEGKKFVRVDTGVFDMRDRMARATTAAKRRAARKAAK